MPLNRYLQVGALASAFRARQHFKVNQALAEDIHETGC
jgi:hypothetical protein